MIAEPLLISMCVLVGGGALCLAFGRRPAFANRFGAAVGVAGALPAVYAAGRVLWTGEQAGFRVPWAVPYGSFSIAVDGLSAFFILAIAVVCSLSAVYGASYLEPSIGRRNVAASWFFYHVLFASMLLVVAARNGVLFLAAWEAMALSSFFLVMFEHERGEVREAGWTYLAASHLGTAFLLAMFALLANGGGTMDFDRFSLAAAAAPAGVLFLLAVVGFGTKAGFLPMHVWLPEAHPAAPSHVSAVMSGVMIKTGIYGLLRVLTFLGAPEAWWGWTLLGVGAASGIVGVLFALAQHDLKRLLAYSSVENIGIICLGLGLWLLGTSSGNAALAAAGLLGGLLHVWNHALFKSLLFLGAGAVAHATGTRDIEQLGGLLKRMPWTGAAFLVGSAAISGLPPLNGFVSEFLIYVGAFGGVAGEGPLRAAAAGLVVIGALALIGGLAAACFAKVCGIAFLGEPRSPAAAEAHEAPRPMRLACWTLAGLCVGIGLAGPLVVSVVGRAAGPLLGGVPAGGEAMATFQGLLWRVSLVGGVLAVLVAGLWLLRRRLLSGRPVERAGTWDCGYAAPTARMQYTASSFAWPICRMFGWLLRPRVHREPPAGLFPRRAAFQSHCPDVFSRHGYGPLFGAFGWLAERMRWLQQGRNQLYVLYIALTLLILLLWKLG